MTGSTWRSARSQRATAGHVDDESIASSSRAAVRPSPSVDPTAAAATSGSHFHPASARAPPRPHWTRSSEMQYPPSRPPTYTTLPRTYPTDPNSQIPASPLRPPGPVATVRGVLANSSAEEEKRRETHSRRAEREEAGESSDDDGEADGEEEGEGDSRRDDETSTVLGEGASISRSLRSSERGGERGAAKSV
ncbi:hypothetical protein LTR01_000944 [Friedmanniomyces endolithicus]|nr:hypothetical protein LTS09_007191 [Friedmanniomyces endolithicus]KAK0315644.1 hypothetical protein LTR01_000944 [Friedmanniomyces endolithicus]KAK0836003.1 hypothetical protein LTR73_000504 [Friedmanniomyces endolithicus]